MIPILQSPVRNLLLGSLLGSVIVASGFNMRQQLPAQSIDPAPAPEWPIAGDQAVTQEAWDFAQQAIRGQHATIVRLQAELAEAQAAAKTAENNPAAQLLAQSGHVMNEEQCRAWSSVSAPPPQRVVQ